MHLRARRDPGTRRRSRRGDRRVSAGPRRAPARRSRSRRSIISGLSFEANNAPKLAERNYKEALKLLEPEDKDNFLALHYRLGRVAEIAGQQRGGRGALQRGRRHRLLLSRRRPAAETLDLTAANGMVCFGAVRCRCRLRTSTCGSPAVDAISRNHCTRIALNDHGSHAKFTLCSQAHAAKRQAPDAQSRHQEGHQDADASGRWRRSPPRSSTRPRPTSRPRRPRSTRPVLAACCIPTRRPAARASWPAPTPRRWRSRSRRELAPDRADRRSSASLSQARDRAVGRILTYGRMPVPREIESHHADPRRRLSTRFATALVEHFGRLRGRVRGPGPVRGDDRACCWTASSGARVGGRRSTAWAKTDLLDPGAAGRGRGARDPRRPARQGRSPRIADAIAPLKHLARWIVEHHGGRVESLVRPGSIDRLAARRAGGDPGHRPGRGRRDRALCPQAAVVSRRSGDLSGAGAPRLARSDGDLRRSPRPAGRPGRPRRATSRTARLRAC